MKEVYAWYEQQKTGLGEEFINEFEFTILAIERNPFQTFNIENLCRSIALKRFPYESINWFWTWRYGENLNNLLPKPKPKS